MLGELAQPFEIDEVVEVERPFQQRVDVVVLAGQPCVQLVDFRLHRLLVQPLRFALRRLALRLRCPSRLHSSALRLTVGLLTLTFRSDLRTMGRPPLLLRLASSDLALPLQFREEPTSSRHGYRPPLLRVLTTTLRGASAVTGRFTDLPTLAPGTVRPRRPDRPRPPRRERPTV